MMDSVLLNSLISALLISLLSLCGIFGFILKDKLLAKVSSLLVALSTGTLLGGAFLHLLPESIENNSSVDTFLYLLLGILSFYLIEKILKWRHCHSDDHCEVHTFTYMSLVGDAVHNFIDGLIIISAFYVSFEVGLVAAIAVASHEIPQELGDFGILIHGGYSRFKALLWNLISASTALVGVLVGYILINNIDNISLALLPFAAGGFVYIAMSDLIPELHKESNFKKSILDIFMLIIGLIIMYLTKIFFE